jgi:tetratricopeptide (TPR) repeat protein
MSTCFSAKPFTLALVMTLLTTAATTVLAQAVTVISNSSNARSCYQAASRASIKMLTTQSDLDTCNVAIDRDFLGTSDLARTHINRGIVATSLEQYQQALADYNKALELVPRMPEAYISRGNLWYLAEKYQRASDEYTMAMQSEFNRPQIAYYNRALANEKLGNRVAAEADLREALKLDPELRQARERLDKLTGEPAQ